MRDVLAHCNAPKRQGLGCKIQRNGMLVYLPVYPPLLRAISLFNSLCHALASGRLPGFSTVLFNASKCGCCICPQVECGEMSTHEFNAFLNTRTTDGKTPLALATISGSVQTVALLCKAGADVNACDRTDASTPLHWAERMNDGGAFKVLVEGNARLNIMNRCGQEPLGRFDVLHEARGTSRHDAANAVRRKQAFETMLAAVDVRYATQLATQKLTIPGPGSRGAAVRRC
jgi:hypothetical protein